MKVGSFSCIPGWIPLIAALSLPQQTANTSRLGDPAALVRKTVENEIKTNHQDIRFMFRGTKTTPKGSVTKLYVETKEATTGIVVAYDGKPLTPEQKRAEQERVERFIRNPEELKKKQKQEQEDTERTVRIVRAIPDAFLFEYDGQESGTAELGKPEDPLVRLKFRPNPNYQPPSRVEQVLRGMQGVLLIDAVGDRIAKIDGELFKDVTFGWGILGHLDKGGHFEIRQRAIGDDRWEICRMDLHFTGKVLLVKSLTIDSTDVYGDYKQVPADLSFALGVEMLKRAQEQFVAAGGTAKGKSDSP